MAECDYEFLGVAYSTLVVPDKYTDGSIGYLASHPELPGCMADGSSPEEALQNLNEARELYLRVLVERGLPVPPPNPVVGSVVWRSEDPGGRAADQPPAASVGTITVSPVGASGS